MSTILAWIVDTIFDLPRREYQDEFVRESLSSILDEQRIFGVFGGVRRSPNQSLPSWPKDVHGSIGFWTPDFSDMSASKLFSVTESVVFDAAWNDSRAAYFEQPLSLDANARVYAEFMLQPLMRIDPNTGIIEGTTVHFDNNEFGLILQGTSTRATYLPGVFEDMTWQGIKQSLEEKAGASTDGDMEFFAYKTLKIEGTLWTIMKSYQYILNSVLFPLSNTFQDLYTQPLTETERVYTPYSITGNKVNRSWENAVRNASTIMQVFWLMQFFTRKKEILQPYLLHDTIFYTNLWQTDPLKYRQSLSSLFHLWYDFNLREEIPNYKQYERELIHSLLEDIPDLEKQFERGQILQTLTHLDISPEQIEVLEDEAYTIMQEEVHNIFQLNWSIQFIVDLAIRYGFPHNKMEQLIGALLLELEGVYWENAETNEIVVAFEALCAILSWQTYVNIDILDVNNWWIHMFILLRKVQRPDSLLAFRDGNARIDITAHFLSGFSKIIS